VRYRERLTGDSLLAKLFPELGQEVTETVEAPHLQLALEQSDASGVPGTRITLAVEVRLPPDVHFYAPDTKGYKPIKLPLDPIMRLQLQRVVYPPSKTLYFAGDQGTSTRFWGIRSHQPGYSGSYGSGVLGFAWQRRENFHDHRKARVSGVRQDHVLCANVRPREMAACSCFQWTARVPPWTFGTNKKLSVLQHLPYALLNLECCAEKF
jgi:hypothetical protein